MKTEKFEAGCLSCAGFETREWYAWLNRMPPPPDDFHVIGEIYVPNPGVTPILVPKVPQGINPAILLLDLYLIQQPGAWPSVFVWKQIRYEKIAPTVRYTQVHIFCEEKTIADIEVVETTAHGEAVG